MLSNIECIALRTVRVNDSRNLLSVWSRCHGRLTLAMPSGKGRESKRRRALTGPLSLFEAVVDIRPDREVATVREMIPMATSPAMLLSPMRAAGATFLAETLDVILRRTEADDILSDFLFSAVAYYGECGGRAAANFHVSFLIHLAEFLGIAPDYGEARHGCLFDIKEGRFVRSAPLHGDYLSSVDSHALLAFGEISLYHCGRIFIERFERRRAIDIIFNYYDLHLCSLEGVKSLSILRQIFD